jgi:SecD/SecF fusion protein
MKNRWLALQMTMVLFCGVGFASCGYSGPKVKFTVEMSPSVFLRSLTSVPADSLLDEVLQEVEEMNKDTTQSAIAHFQDVVKRKGAEVQVARWFAKEDELRSNAPYNEAIEYLDAQWEAATTTLFSKIQQRFAKFSAYDADLRKQPNRIVVTVNKVDDLKTARQLLRSAGKLGFYATYGIRQVGVQLRESCRTLIMEDTLGTGPDLAGLIQLDQQIVQNKSQPNDNATLGMVAVQDTHLVRQLLEKIRLASGLPNDLRWAWSATPFAGSEPPSFELIALHTVKGQPEIDGTVIEEANLDHDLDGNICIAIRMNARGAQSWEQMTTQNQNRQVAIVLDGMVYSAPYVNEPITGGKSWISGAFTEEEAKALAAVLAAGAFPSTVHLIGEEEIQTDK